jgi:hypothetical protein
MPRSRAAAEQKEDAKMHATMGWGLSGWMSWTMGFGGVLLIVVLLLLVVSALVKLFFR